MNETPAPKWDAPTRILHALIALCLVTLFGLALVGEAAEDILGERAETIIFLIHFYVGLGAIALVAIRILWGFFGNDAVNWRGFPAGFARFPASLKAEIAWRTTGVDSPGRKKGGHNALAVPVYLAALFFFTIQAISGLLLWPHLEKEAQKHLGFSGPALTSSAYAHGGERHEKGEKTMGTKEREDDYEDAKEREKKNESDKEDEWFEEIHEFGMFWLPIFLILHLGGLYLHYKREDREVFRAMLWPRKSGLLLLFLMTIGFPA